MITKQLQQRGYSNGFDTVVQNHYGRSIRTRAGAVDI